MLRLLLLIPLCVSIVEGDDVGKFELCIELLSAFLYSRDAVFEDEKWFLISAIH